ncbi:AFL218Cp [Eremothecium gossypii ATCC 10895]|uniref:Potassium transport protein n=1 Tax=Eremothecium gossypii (strain ATCC 10895 / CBS 109.51 / FGSC 9923 / NRRL Y-1056) TaxID=284811 RepID=Q755N2_EREGS|nr:AFL218Cp [Eremothecium gossypii ATCC 10895]AAS53156.2 AFL218Cp [Eremothecium gossypii ATCC 10895]AEY97466.1 FAFL218Cp [Eremothecium gossypii FDAG1]
MGLARSLSRHPTIQYFHSTYKKTVGHKLRDVISAIVHRLHPIFRKLLPNFIAAHYFYIITMALLCSILVYPVKNAAYIDVLFLSAGAATQGGLNTIDICDLSLYQQIVLYLVSMFTTPIWIHGMLVFVRLFWFERYFDGIKSWSKKNFQMRRTRTLVARELSRSMSSSRHWPKPDRHLKGSDRRLTRTSTATNDFQNRLFSGKLVNREESNVAPEDKEPRVFSTACSEVAPSPSDSNSKASNRTSSLGTTSVSSGVAPGSISNKSEPDLSRQSPAEPLSAKRDREVTPADLVRSITMMQSQHRKTEDEDGPALVIKGPHERTSGRTSGNEGEDYEDEGVPSRDSTEKTRRLDLRKRPLSGRSSQGGMAWLTPSQSLSAIEQRRSGDYSDVSSALETATEAHDHPSWKQGGRTAEPTSELPRSTTSAEQLASATNNGPSIHFEIGNMPRPPTRQNLQRHDTGSSKYGESSDNKKSGRPGLLRRLSASGGIKDFLMRNNGSASVTRGDNDHVPDSVSSDNDSAIESTGSEENDETGDSRNRTYFRQPSRDAQTPESIRAEDLRRSFRRRRSTGLSLKKLQLSASFNKILGDRVPNALRRKSKRTSNASLTSADHSADSVDSYSNYYDQESGYGGLDLDGNEMSHVMSTNYLSYNPNIGRNSIFIGLTDAQKVELGGVEYRATKLLCRILVTYYFGFHALIVIFLLPWIHSSQKYKDIVASNGVSTTWWAFFTSQSAFNDVGFTLTKDSMLSFSKASFPLVVMIFFIIFGNTGFPILLRFIIWVMFKLAPDLSLMKENLGFLLDHPRRCFTLLFPRAATWWLFLIVVGLNSLDLILFIVLDLNSSLLNGMHAGQKVIDGLFQAVNTRTAGLAVVDLSQLHPSIQVSYMLMMYISVLPVAISIRRTNVYEEQSLGIYGNLMPIIAEASTTGTSAQSRLNKHGSTKEDVNIDQEQDTKSFVRDHLRKQLSFDLWYMFLGLFIICIVEGDRIQDPNEPTFDVFHILFEVVSAYGTVGLSLGFPNTNQSFSAQFKPLSKFVIVAMLIRGRHRGLPYKLDRAIMLPSDKLKQIDNLEDLKLQKTATSNKDPLLQYWRRRAKPVSTGIAQVLSRTKSHTSRSSDHSHIPIAVERGEQATGAPLGPTASGSIKSDYVMRRNSHKSTDQERSPSTISPLQPASEEDMDPSGHPSHTVDAEPNKFLA